jgi:hypothetical protein
VARELDYDGIRGGDVFAGPINPLYDLESVEVTNSGATDISLAAGYPFDGAVPVTKALLHTNGGTDAVIDGFTIQPVVLPAGETVKLPILRRGHVAVNQSALPAKDYSNVAWTAGDLTSACTTLGFVLREGPELTGEHTT